MKLEPITAPSVAKLVYHALIEELRSGKYEVGARFPTESEAAQQLGVSRATVREVYSALRFAEILVTRPGVGTYVRSIPPAETDQQGLAESVGNASLRQAAIHTLEDGNADQYVVEARHVLECAGLRLALVRRTEADIARMRSAVEEMRQSVINDDPHRMYAGNVAFHVALARASRNPVLGHLIASLMDEGQHNAWYELLERGEPAHVRRGVEERVVHTHESLCSAIEDRDEDAALAALEDHFGVLRDVLGVRLPAEAPLTTTTQRAIPPREGGKKGLTHETGVRGGDSRRNQRRSVTPSGHGSDSEC
ncbi:MAG: FadR/GntR family transcriptional regulator [Candidatus Bipolaricaulota bacterium]